MRSVFILLLSVFMPGTPPAFAAGVETDLVAVMAEAPRSTCSDRLAAEKSAKDLAMGAVRSHCRTQGYGWRAATVKDLGKLSCNSCGRDEFACGYDTVRLECRQTQRHSGWTDFVGWLR